MPDKFEAYATSLQLSHRALLRNLEVLVRETALPLLRRYAYTKELTL
jgi:hypothetical protein